jgi:hypothetical protein
LSVQASDPDLGPQPLTYAWSLLSGPIGGTASFSPNGTSSSSTTAAAFNVVGVYNVQVSVSDGLASTTGMVTVTVTSVVGPFSAKINFQPAGAAIPSGYLPDTGDVFASRGNGLSFGWSANHTDNTRDRNVLADQRLDTLCHFHAGAKWEIQVPNGTYNVFVSIGDPSFSSAYTLNVENVSYWSNLSLATNSFASKTMLVTVTDGRLTLDQGSAVEKATRINYIEITGL